MFVRAFLSCLVLLGLSGQAAPPRYAEGQVWEYRTRPQDSDSLLKIRRIETVGGQRVYHISVVGLSFGGASGAVGHLPVSDATLDASVTRLSMRAPDFPADFEQGIAQWREAQGGVFTIPMVEIVDILARQVTSLPEPATEPGATG